MTLEAVKGAIDLGRQKCYNIEKGGTMDNYSFQDIQVIIDGNDVSIDGVAAVDAREELVELMVNKAYFWDGIEWRQTNVDAATVRKEVNKDINLIRAIKGE